MAGGSAMDKREFLKASGALIAGAILPKMGLAEEQAVARTNWSGNYTYSTDKLDLPKNAADVQAIMRRGSKLKALGARHSFNGIADSTGEQISLKGLDSMELDAKARTVTVGAGITYGQLAPYIDSRGYAVHNLASLPHVSVVGACSTATHGSGVKNGNLSTAVVAIEMVTADSEIVGLSREKMAVHFAGAVVGLGALGMVTKITLNVEPTFQVRQVVYENLSMDQLEKHMQEIFASAYSVSLFTDWQNHRITQVWLKHKVTPGEKFEFAPELYGAKLATQKLHPLAGHSAENCTEQLGIPGPWYERLPHFRMNFTPSSGAELQSEYFVPLERGYEAMLAVEQLRDRVTPHLFVTELRTIEADQLWTSMTYQRSSMALHFTWKPEWPEVKKVLPLIEAKLAPFGARPHWAKLFTMAPQHLRAQYPRMAEFQALAKHYDPQGKLRNAYLDTNIYG
jgi:alditol oxidase